MRKMFGWFGVFLFVAFVGLVAAPAAAQDQSELLSQWQALAGDGGGADWTYLGGYVRDAEWGSPIAGIAGVEMNLYYRFNFDGHTVLFEVARTSCDPTGWSSQGCPNWDGWYWFQYDKWGGRLSAGPYWMSVRLNGYQFWQADIYLSAGWNQIDVALSRRDGQVWMNWDTIETRGRQLVFGFSTYSEESEAYTAKALVDVWA